MPTSQPIDLLVSGGTLLNPAGPAVTIDDAAVGVTGGKILFACARRNAPDVVASETLDASGCLVMPGLVNTHHHMFQTLTRAHPKAINKELFPWLQALFPIWAKNVDPENFRLATRLAIVGFALMFVARPAAVFLCLAPFPFPRREKIFISWVGLRGAVAQRQAQGQGEAINRVVEPEHLVQRIAETAGNHVDYRARCSVAGEDVRLLEIVAAAPRT